MTSPILIFISKNSLQVYCTVNDRLRRRILKTKLNCIGTHGTGFSFLKLKLSRRNKVEHDDVSA